MHLMFTLTYSMISSQQSPSLVRKKPGNDLAVIRTWWCKQGEEEGGQSSCASACVAFTGGKYITYVTLFLLQETLTNTIFSSYMCSTFIQPIISLASHIAWRRTHASCGARRAPVSDTRSYIEWLFWETLKLTRANGPLYAVLYLHIFECQLFFAVLS